jgi:hypothetical protein
VVKEKLKMQQHPRPNFNIRIQLRDGRYHYCLDIGYDILEIEHYLNTSTLCYKYALRLLVF